MFRTPDEAHTYQIKSLTDRVKQLYGHREEHRRETGQFMNEDFCYVATDIKHLKKECGHYQPMLNNWHQNTTNFYEKIKDADAADYNAEQVDCMYEELEEAFRADIEALVPKIEENGTTVAKHAAREIKSLADLPADGIQEKDVPEWKAKVDAGVEHALQAVFKAQREYEAEKKGHALVNSLSNIAVVKRRIAEFNKDGRRCVNLSHKPYQTQP